MSMTTESDPRERDDIASYFERSAYVVHSYAERIEHNYARPAMKTAAELFNEHPVPFVFFCFFSVLSIFPILLFFFCSILVTLSFVFFALSAALLGSASFIFMFSCLLLLVLVTNTCLAIFPTVTLFWTYTLLRLVSLTRSGGRAGAAKWVDESKSFLGSRLRFKKESKDLHSSPSGSDGSMVLVEADAKQDLLSENYPNGIKHDD